MRRAAPRALPPALMPGRALAHASERMVILTLPTGRYIARRRPGRRTDRRSRPPRPAPAGAPPAPPRRLPRPRPGARHELDRRPSPSGLIACGFWGSRDPLANPLPLAVWTGLWVGLSLACLFLGNLWRPLNPWTGPAATLRRAARPHAAAIGLARLGAWPAALGLLAFAWFEIVSLAPADPAVLARTALLYWLVILARRRARGRGLARARRGPHRLFRLHRPHRAALARARRRPRAADGRPARRPDPRDAAARPRRGRLRRADPCHA